MVHDSSISIYQNGNPNEMHMSNQVLNRACGLEAELRPAVLHVWSFALLLTVTQRLSGTATRLTFNGEHCVPLSRCSVPPSQFEPHMKQTLIKCFQLRYRILPSLTPSSSRLGGTRRFTSKM